MTSGPGHPVEGHTDLCEQIHTLLVQANDASLRDVARALFAAEEAAHALCPGGG